LAAEIDSSIGVVYQDGTDYIVGWQFTTAVPISVYGLGIFDSNGDGLSQTLEVGIYNAADALVAYTSFAGVGNIGLVDEFQFQSIAPTYLAPGTYLIASTTTSNGNTFEDFAFFAAPFYAPQITPGPAFIDFGSVLFRPTVDVTGDGLEDLWGPNFLFEVAPPIPEPSTWAAGVMLVLAVGGAWYRRR